MDNLCVSRCYGCVANRCDVNPTCVQCVQQRHQLFLATHAHRQQGDRYASSAVAIPHLNDRHCRDPIAIFIARHLNDECIRQHWHHYFSLTGTQTTVQLVDWRHGTPRHPTGLLEAAYMHLAHRGMSKRVEFWTLSPCSSDSVDGRSAECAPCYRPLSRPPSDLNRLASRAPHPSLLLTASPGA